MAEEKIREMTEEKINETSEKSSEESKEIEKHTTINDQSPESVQEDEMAEEDLDQVSGGYYPQMWSEKKDKAQERVYS